MSANLFKPTDDHHTHTSDEQKQVEDSCQALYDQWQKDELGETGNTKLTRSKHVYYLLRGLNGLSRGYSSLDASRPWLVYWIIHALELLGVMHQMSDKLANNVVNFLNRCQHPNGGFAGGPGQMPHLAPTYASVSALMIVGARKTTRAFEIINRAKLYNFLLNLKHECGAFRVSVGGEMDTRGVYCALAAASMTNLVTPELTRNTASWVASCQTFEGGIGGEPGNEAHGGYAFCGLASLAIMGKMDLIDAKRFLKWAANRQMGLEGGFQGRTNKLVDGCYSYWVGGLFPLLSYIFQRQSSASAQSPSEDEKAKSASESCNSDNTTEGSATEGEKEKEGDTTTRGEEEEEAARVAQTIPLLFRREYLQKYVVVCCQSTYGGLVDKPGKGPDYYHTCYTLSGLSVAQHSPTGPRVFGHKDNQLEATNPIYNIGVKSYEKVVEYYGKLVHPTTQAPQ